MTLENLIGKGLQREPASAEEISRLKLRLLDEFRRHRAAGLYDGSFVPTQAELDELRATATDLKGHLETWLIERHPELSTVK